MNQTFKDFEFIICDDGSTNETYTILQEIAQGKKAIKLLKNEKNSGLAYTLNHCLSIAEGQYIARMDADDISLPDRLENEVKFLDQHKEYSFVGCNVYLINDNGRWGERRYNEKIEVSDFLFNSPFTHPTVMIRKVDLDAVGGYSVEKITRRAEDYDLWMRLYARGYKGYNIQDKLFEFREDADALARRKYKYRLDEARIRYRGFCALGLMPYSFLWVLKPLVIGALPDSLLQYMRSVFNK